MTQDSHCSHTVATLALTLAPLVIAGCGPDCRQFRSTLIGSTPWSSIQKDAPRCLDKQEAAALERVHARYSQLISGPLVEQDHTVQDLIDEDRTWADNAAQGERAVAAANALQSMETAAAEGGTKQPGPWVLQNAVQFVFPDTDSGVAEGTANPNIPMATAFVLVIPEKAEHPRPLLFLVTDRHVVEPSWIDCSAQAAAKDPSAIRVQFRNADGSWSLERIALRSPSGQVLYKTLPDEDIDLALVLLTRETNPSLPNYRFLSVPFRNVMTDPEADRYDVNAEVMASGLQPDAAGAKLNLPVFKKGVLSSKRTEPVAIPCENQEYRRNVRMWIVQAPFTKGMSGAPVFTTVNRGAGKEHYPVLVGVQSAGWPNTDGLAGITPALYLVQLVQQETAQWNVNLARP